LTCGILLLTYLTRDDQHLTASTACEMTVQHADAPPPQGLHHIMTHLCNASNIITRMGAIDGNAIN